MTIINDFKFDANLIHLDQMLMPVEDMALNQGDMQISQDMQIISSSSCPIPSVRQSKFILRNLLPIPLDASRSYDLDSASQKPIFYQWEIIEQPLQSNPTISENNLYVSHANQPEMIPDDLSTPFAYFLPDQFGKYVISLKVKDETGLESPSENCIRSDETITIEVEENKVDIQLFWQTPDDQDPFDNIGVDLDLHLFHPILGFNGDQLDWDDSQASCSALNPFPNWNNEFGRGDPTLAQDAIYGFGPEYISLKSPENTMDLAHHYRIAVRYYEPYDLFPPIEMSNHVTATVVVYIKGKFVGEWTKILSPTDYLWEVADLFWSDDQQGIISIDQTTTCQPQGVETCDWIDNDCNGLIDDTLSDFPRPCQSSGLCRQGVLICEFGQEICKNDWVALDDDCRSDQNCCEYGQCVPSSEQSIAGLCIITCDPSDPFAFNSLRVCEDDEICLSLPQNEQIGFCKKADHCGPGSQVINCFDSETCIRNEILTYCEAIPDDLQPTLKDLGEDCDENHFCKSQFVCEFGKCRQACSVGCQANEVCIDLSRTSGSTNYQFCLDTCDLNLDCAFEEMCALKEFYDIERDDEDFGTRYETLSIKVCEPRILHPKQLNEICQTTSPYFYHIASDCAEGLVCIEDYSSMFENRLTCKKLCEYGDNSCQSNEYCNESILPVGGVCIDE